jgi:hypothetical protein
LLIVPSLGFEFRGAEPRRRSLQVRVAVPARPSQKVSHPRGTVFHAITRSVSVGRGLFGFEFSFTVMVALILYSRHSRSQRFLWSIKFACFFRDAFPRFRLPFS